MKKLRTPNRIAECLFEIINDNNGYRDEMHKKWAESDKRYLRTLTLGKNISYENNIIEIQNGEATKTLYKITVEKI